MEFYSITKKNEILSSVGKWTELKNIILSEVSQVRRPKATCFLSYVENRPHAKQQYYKKHNIGEVTYERVGVKKRKLRR
jgi:hypothetical protein